MTLVRWNPVKDFCGLDREFDRFFNWGVTRDSADPEVKNAVWFPSTDISEDEKQFELKIDLPGVDPKDVSVKIENSKLVISGKREMEEESKDKNYHRVERKYGSYSRSFSLPETVKQEEINAEFKHGQLTIVIPKAEKALPKQIEVKLS